MGSDDSASLPLSLYSALRNSAGYAGKLADLKFGHHIAIRAIG
jgi:hypothetical protein